MANCHPRGTPLLPHTSLLAKSYSAFLASTVSVAEGSLSRRSSTMDALYVRKTCGRARARVRGREAHLTHYLLSSVHAVPCHRDPQPLLEPWADASVRPRASSSAWGYEPLTRGCIGSNGQQEKQHRASPSCPRDWPSMPSVPSAACLDAQPIHEILEPLVEVGGVHGVKKLVRPLLLCRPSRARPKGAGGGHMSGKPGGLGVQGT
jgi:hypothetical protein